MSYLNRPVPEWPTVGVTYKKLRDKLATYGTDAEKIAVLSYWRTLLEADIAALSAGQQLPPL